MTIKELIENGKGYLELNGNKIDLDNKQFKDIMKWNESIANGEVRDGIAYSKNDDKLEWNWVSLEEDLQEIAKEEMEDVIEEIAEEIVDDIVTTEKGKNKTK